MADYWVSTSQNWQGLWGVAQWWWVTTDSNPRRKKPWTGDRLLGAHSLLTLGGYGGQSCLIWSKKTTVAQVTEIFNAIHGMTVSQHIVLYTLLHVGLHSHRPIKVPLLTPLSRIMCPATLHILFRNGVCYMIKISRCYHGHQIQYLWDVLEQQVPSVPVPPLKDLKDLLLTSWCLDIQASAGHSCFFGAQRTSRCSWYFGFLVYTEGKDD